jgi:membrane protein
MLLYQLMPNTRVDWRAALVGGGVAALLWIANGNFNALFASKVVSASRIYGSLGAIPIFLLGMYLSWTILLFGAQVAYAFQNRRAYVQEKQAESVNQRGREFIALRVMTLVAARHHRGEKPPTALEMAEQLGVSSRLVSQVIQPLIRQGLVLEVAVPATAYAPGRPLTVITFHDVLQAVRVGHGFEPGTREDPARERVKRGLEAIQAAEREVAGRVTFDGVVRDLDSGRSG